MVVLLEIHGRPLRMDPTMAQRIGPPLRLMTFEGSKGLRLQRIEGFKSLKVDDLQGFGDSRFPKGLLPFGS